MLVRPWWDWIPYIPLVGINNCAVLWKTVRRLLKKLKVELYDPAMLLLDIHPKELKSGSWGDACNLMSTIALLTTAKTWKNPNVQTRWMDKEMWYKLFSLRKEKKKTTLAICINIGEPRTLCWVNEPLTGPVVMTPLTGTISNSETHRSRGWDGCQGPGGRDNGIVFQWV